MAAWAETARQALLVAVQTLGTNQEKVREAEERASAQSNALLEACEGLHMVVDSWGPETLNHKLLYFVQNPSLTVAILARGADPNTTGPYGFTPTQVCVIYGYERSLQVLLDGGANIQVQDEQGRTLAHLATEADSVECLELLLDKGIHYYGDLVFEAVRSNSMGCLQLLINRGAELNRTAASGMTPLHLAAMKDHVQGLTKLIRAGADINSGYRSGVTPIHVAAERGHAQCLKVLLDHGADPTVMTGDGETSWDIATRHGRTECLQLLEF